MSIIIASLLHKTLQLDACICSSAFMCIMLTIHEEAFEGILKIGQFIPSLWGGGNSLAFIHAMITGHSLVAACEFEATVAVFRQGTWQSLIQCKAREPSLWFVYYIEPKLGRHLPRLNHLSPENGILNIHSREVRAAFRGNTVFSTGGKREVLWFRIMVLKGKWGRMCLFEVC